MSRSKQQRYRERPKPTATQPGPILYGPFDDLRVRTVHGITGHPGCSYLWETDGSLWICDAAGIRRKNYPPIGYVMDVFPFGDGLA